MQPILGLQNKNIELLFYFILFLLKDSINATNIIFIVSFISIMLAITMWLYQN